MSQENNNNSGNNNLPKVLGIGGIFFLSDNLHAAKDW